MELRVSNGSRIRLKARKPFVDVRGEDFGDALSISLYDRLSFFQIRKKNEEIKLFIFNDEEQVNEFDFGFFSDAEILFSRGIKMNKY